MDFPVKNNVNYSKRRYGLVDTIEINPNAGTLKVPGGGEHGKE